MQLPASERVASRLEFLDEVGSTNDVLRARAGSDPEFSVVVTTSQTAGRGRLGRAWVAPPGRTLAASVLLKPGEAHLDRLGWLPLLAGLAMTRAVSALVAAGSEPAHEVSLKWPNDVHIDGLKVSGILTEFVPPAAVVVGAGLNLEMTADELPTPQATSLTLNGVQLHGAELVDAALAAFLSELRAQYDSYLAHGADATASGLRDSVVSACSTIGRAVRVELPGAPDLYGTAEGIDDTGRLLVARDGDRRLQAVAAGDVTHLRYE
jgi:BirA family biotin operon repressor/biotin-[acetyl-CoA-carboxylase] ligase